MNTVATPPPAPTPLSPPSQNDIELSPADPYTIPDTPYISAHSNRATDGNVSAYDPNAFDSEYIVRDLSQTNANTNKPPTNTGKAKQITQLQENNNISSKLKSIFSSRCILISIVIIIIIVTVIIISISVYPKRSQQHSFAEEMDEIAKLKEELVKLERKTSTQDKDKNNKQTLPTQQYKTSQPTKAKQNNTKRRLVPDIHANQSSSLSTQVQTTLFTAIVIFTIVFGMFTSFLILHL